MFYALAWWRKPDPGPCPVDDAPHTTCTSPDYVPAQVILAAGTTPAPIVAPAPVPLTLRVELSTKTYKRKTFAAAVQKARTQP